jgi:hypothetical protein
MTRLPDGWDVGGPVLAEVFVLWLDRDVISITGPDGPQAWLIELGESDHPVSVVDRLVRDAMGDPLLVHSTSWRRDRAAVILSFVVVVDEQVAASMPSRPIVRADLARSEARAAPREIATDQVVEHALRHLAWLAEDDPVVRDELSDGWRSALRAYVPEPFRNLG